jgi:hypothetical protein
MIQAPARAQGNSLTKPAAPRAAPRRAPPARARQVLDDAYLQGPAARQAPSFDADSKAGGRAEVWIARADRAAPHGDPRGAPMAASPSLLHAQAARRSARARRAGRGAGDDDLVALVRGAASMEQLLALSSKHDVGASPELLTTYVSRLSTVSCWPPGRCHCPLAARAPARPTGARPPPPSRGRGARRRRSPPPASASSSCPTTPPTRRSCCSCCPCSPSMPASWTRRASRCCCCRWGGCA